MSALDKLSNYSAREGVKPAIPSVFDTKTPEGALLDGIHRRGYAMYKRRFVGADGSELSEQEYFELPEVSRLGYKETVEYTELHDVLTTAGNQVINAVAGSGKALFDNTQVLTNTGWVGIRYIRVDDLVAGTDGKFHKVVGTYPQGYCDVYSVKMSDGKVINCNGDHLWTLENGRVLKTTDLMELHVAEVKLPPCEPVDGTLVVGTDYSTISDVEFAKKQTLGMSAIYVDAYALGCCALGGWRSGELRVLYRETAMKHVLSWMKFLHPDSDWVGDETDDLSLAYSLVSEFSSYIFHSNFRIKDGHIIPECVRFGSIQTKLDYLRGIIDTVAEFDGCSYTIYHEVDLLQFGGFRTFEADFVDLCKSLTIPIKSHCIGDYFYFEIKPIERFGALHTAPDLPEVKEYVDPIQCKIVGIEKLPLSVPMTCIEVDSEDKNFIIEGYAPTHNTTALVLKILHDIVTGEAVTLKGVPGGNQVRVVNKMWVCTFLKTGASELETALTAWQRKMGYSITSSQVNFSTLDAEFKRCLNAMGCETPIGDTSRLLKKAIDSCNITRSGYPLSKEDYKIIGGIVTYYRGRLDDQKYNHPACTDYDITPTILDLLVNQFEALRRAEHVMDFEEIMELLYRYLYIEPNPAVQQFVSERYNFIYVDEFQDTSQMAYAILKFYARGNLWMNSGGEKPVEGNCLPAGTKVEMVSGEFRNIENIYPGDFVKACIGDGKVGNALVEAVSNREFRGNLIKVSTASGHTVVGTPEHRIPVYANMWRADGIVLGNPKGGTSLHQRGESMEVHDYEHLVKIRQDKDIPEYHMFSDDMKIHIFVELGSINEGVRILVRDDSGVHWEVVTKVDTEYYKGTVYDLGVACFKNFIASGVVVHNCNYYTDGLYTGHETLGKLVAVGDPSQCLTGDTKVTMQDGGTKPISEVQEGDFVRCCIGQGLIGSAKVTSIYRKKSDLVYCVTVESGRSFRATAGHRIPVKASIHKDDLYEGDLIIGGRPGGSVTVTGTGGSASRGIDALEILRRGNDGRELAAFVSRGYQHFVRVRDLTLDNLVLVEDSSGVHFEQIVSIVEEDSSEYVYDISVSGFRNFFANGIVVHNCIYSFRGSDSKILTDLIDKDFRPTISKLSVNWRCPANILSPIVPSIHQNSDSASQDIIPAREGGEFVAYTFNGYQSMVAQLKTDIAKDIDDGLSVAILCRTNFDGMIPALMLESDKRFDFGISGENMTLSSALPRKILGVTSLFLERSTPTVKTSLEFFSSRGSQWQIKQLIDTLKLNNQSIWTIPLEDLKYSCYSLVEFVQSVRFIIMPDGKKRDKDKDMDGLKYVYNYMLKKTFSGDSAYNEAARAYIETLLFIIKENDYKTIYDFLEDIEFLNDKLHGRIGKTRCAIQIATVHEFKGKERDSVYVWNDSEGIFPSSKCDSSNRDQYEEERRVHYIACTRARKRQHIYTLRGKVGDFVKEMDLVLESPVIKSVKLGV